MKLTEIKEDKLPKAESAIDLIGSIKDGKFTKDGSHIKINNGFYCYNKGLTSLQGAPNFIGGHGGFDCSYNSLTSLQGAPSIVHGAFDCANNNLTSLQGVPNVINGHFFCYNNKQLKHILGLLKIKGLQRISMDNKEVQYIINKYLPEGDLLACIDELQDAGFEEYAKL